MFKVFMLYEVNPTTWFYLSSLMIIGIFFKFRRVWSIRNLDIISLLFLAPGMMLVANGYEYRGYCLLFFVLFFLLLRMMCDPLLVRRPLLEVNLSRGGMTFSCIALMVFLIAGVALTQWREPGSPQTATLQQLLRKVHINRILDETALAAERSVGGEAAESDPAVRRPMVTHAPGVPFFTEFANLPMEYLTAQAQRARLAAAEAPGAVGAEGVLPPGNEFQLPGGQKKRVTEFPMLKDGDKSLTRQIFATHAVAIAAQIMIVLGIILIGSVHFENLGTGIAAATFYLLLPYAAQIPARIDHLVPAALMVWAIFCYRVPALAGVLIGFAAAFAYYPLFLIPLWCGFYWSRGLIRFICTSLPTFALLVLIAVVAVGGVGPFMSQLGDTFSFASVFSRNAGGFWNAENHNLEFRIPVIAAYAILATVLAFWPSQKNFGTLLSSSAALMIGCQYCHPFEGGLYMAWFLPMMILVIFRPNLEDRIAVRALAKRPGGKPGVVTDGD